MAKLPLAVKLALASALAASGCVRHDLLGTVAGDGGAGDAAATPPRFSPPVLVAALSDTASIDEDPTFTGDLLELYFMSTRAGDRDIWTSTRASADDPWGAP